MQPRSRLTQLQDTNHSDANKHREASPDPTGSNNPETAKNSLACMLHLSYDSRTSPLPVLVNGGDPGSSIKPPPDFRETSLDL